MKSGRDNASLNRQNVSRQCLPRPNSDSFAVPVTKSTAYFSRSHHWQLLWQPKVATKSDNRWIPTRELPSEASFFFPFSWLLLSVALPIDKQSHVVVTVDVTVFAVITSNNFTGALDDAAAASSCRCWPDNEPNREWPSARAGTQMFRY